MEWDLRLTTLQKLRVVILGNVWAIPENAEKPKDERVKSGKFVAWRKK